MLKMILIIINYLVLLLWFTINRKPYTECLLRSNEIFLNSIDIGFTNHLVYYYGSFSFVFYLWMFLGVSAPKVGRDSLTKSWALWTALWEHEAIEVDGSEMPTKYIQCGAPPVVRWFINPMTTIVISTIDHSYWSY